MADGDDSIVLTEREREVLAGLADSIGDPWLAGQLAGQQPTTPARPRLRRAYRWPAAVTALSGWLGLLLVVAGAVLAATTFIHSIAMASLGLTVMGAGLGRLVVDRGEAIARGVKAAGQWRPAGTGLPGQHG